MHPNEELITKFYTAFQKRDSATMAECYHPNVTFSDAAFVDLKGDEARAMWKMLCERGTDLVVECRDVKADDTSGSAHWEAHYTFSKTGAKVHNIIDANFKFKDGLIIEHRDHFNFRRWSGQALGLPGKLLGWSSYLQKKVQAQSKATLAKYMGKQPTG